MHNKLDYHAVWGTKYRVSVLDREFIIKLTEHIKEYAIQKSILIHEIDGSDDHLHCVFRLPKDKTVAKVIQLLKGESSYWVNKSAILKYRFGWADDYYAEAISPEKLEVIKTYVRNQQNHHKKISFQEELKKFLTEKDFFLKI
jgi:putative transposase